MSASTLSPAKPAQAMLDIIRTAAADCRAQGNTAAANELLDAAGMANGLLLALLAMREASGGKFTGWHPKYHDACQLAEDAIAKAQGGAA